MQQHPNVPLRPRTPKTPKVSGVVAVVPYNHVEVPLTTSYSLRSLGTPNSDGDKVEVLRRDPFYAKLLSIRVVLVCITILTVITMGIGLIILSVQAQDDIIGTLSARVTDEVIKEITSQSGNLFQWADNELLTSRQMFQLEPNLPNIAPGANPFDTYPILTEYMWSIVRRHPIGIEAEFNFLDGRVYGLESFDYSSDIYWADFQNGSLYEVGWKVPLNQTVASVNKTHDNLYFDFQFGDPYPWIVDNNRTFLTSCDSPSTWFDLFMYIGSVANYYIISDYATVCNTKGEMIGYMSVSLGLSSIVDLLRSITIEIKGFIFIMDTQYQLVASSTNSDIFTLHPDMSYTRNTIYSNNETWIQEVVDLLDNDFDEHRRTVSINGTKYYLNVVRWNVFSGIDWYFVMLLEQDQFLGNSRSFFVKCIIAATLVAAAAIGVVLLVTWATTKPLFILASDLQKMSQLDLEVTDMETPRLFEVGRLYRSVASMYIALRSFKKFVPVQVISKIIKSEKEAQAELQQAKITIMFQDIEGFTSLSETMDPVTLAKLTSEYMETMTEIICKHGGTIDKYIGDCIMSLFNAPEKLQNHPVAAATAAQDCMKALARKNVEWKAKYGCQMQARIGINTGDVLIGNMGSEHRMNYTAFGDSVNVAARLEGVNKYFGTRIIVSKAVFSTFGTSQNEFLTRKLSKVRVSGKAKPTAIYEIRPLATPGTLELFRAYESALKCYKNKNFERALEHIKEALEYEGTDLASLKLKERIDFAINLQTLPENWTYIDDLTKF